MPLIPVCLRGEREATSQTGRNESDRVSFFVSAHRMIFVRAWEEENTC